VLLLPSRAGLYFLLAMCLFPQAGYLGVWGKLTAALDGLGLAVPSPRALRDLRRRIGAAPVKRLFEILAGAAGAARHAGDHVRRVPDGLLRRLQVGQGARYGEEPLIVRIGLTRTGRDGLRSAPRSPR
jgi:hypothetical protein